jgi:quercetin dioxygenase-like cupin family protein
MQSYQDVMEAKPMSHFINLEEHELREMVPGGFMKTNHTDHMTLAHWYFEEGAVLPEHSHPHEQISMIIEGEFELKVGDETQRIKPGMVVTIPPNIVHGGRSLVKSYHIDIFYPVREDYL